MGNGGDINTIKYIPVEVIKNINNEDFIVYINTSSLGMDRKDHIEIVSTEREIEKTGYIQLNVYKKGVT